jgi:hypothetical protein
MLVMVVYLYMASVVEWALDLDAVFDGIHFVLMVPDTPIPDRGYLVDDNHATKFDPRLQALWVFNVRVPGRVCLLLTSKR